MARTQDGVYKRPLVKLAPLFYKESFGKQNRAGDVGASSNFHAIAAQTITKQISRSLSSGGLFELYI